MLEFLYKLTTTATAARWTCVRAYLEGQLSVGRGPRALHQLRRDHHRAGLEADLGRIVGRALASATHASPLLGEVAGRLALRAFHAFSVDEAEGHVGDWR